MFKCPACGSQTVKKDQTNCEKEDGTSVVTRRKEFKCGAVYKTKRDEFKFVESSESCLDIKHKKQLTSH